MPVADGHVRLIEIGELSCGPCIASLPVMQRLQNRFSQIRTVYVTVTEGTWGNRLVDPDAEAEQLAEMYMKNLKVGFPVSIWKRKKVVNEDGGMVPEDGSPNLANYPPVGTPTFYVLDGNGRVRRVSIGQITPEREAELGTLLESLIKEQHQ